jgi:Zn-dependent M28 family amino/carboxypeptidase
MKASKVVVCVLALGLAACDAGSNGDAAGPDGISADDIAAHVAVLASDEFEGRGPSSPGEEKTVAYLAEQFRAAGLQPGNGDSYFQEVPLVDITADPDTKLTFTGAGGNRMDLVYAADMMVWTERVVEHSAVENSEVVFVGYGIVAPEYDWNDYAGLDVAGKTVIILVNDPGFATGDPALFTGKAMTYYGRWTYKFEEAARQGAAAALVVHQTAPAAYGWDTVRNSWSGPQFKLETENGNMHRVAIEGWITEQAAQTLFGQTGVDFDTVAAMAASRDFKPRHLGRTASVSVTNKIRHSRSKNVVALLPGSEAPDEYFLYMAHWDHLGIDRTIEGDGIYNGAMDNATGTAGLLELAQAFAGLEQSPRRSMVFLAVTAEEQGTLGSAHYAANPLFPLHKTVAGLNMDGLNVIGLTAEITVTGYGLSELDEVLQEAAAVRGRRVEPDPQPEHGYYFRSDHFELAKLGVPMIYPKRGVDHLEKGLEYGIAREAQYRAERYHMPSDEIDDTWDLSGAAADVRLYYDVGLAVANSFNWPNWYETSAFRAIRDASLASGESDLEEENQEVQ